MIIPKAIIEQVVERVDIVDLISAYIPVQHKGGRVWACCPFHHEKTPSFTIDPVRKSYYCFGCQMKGNLFQFYMQMEGVSFPEAVTALASRVGIEITVDHEEVLLEANERKALQELYQRLTSSFEHLLWNSRRGEEALRYLTKRGLSETTLRTFRVGYGMEGAQDLYHFLIKRGYSDAFLSRSGLFAKKNIRYSIFSDRILFPLMNISGDVVAYSGRAMPDAKADAPKYINSPETLLFSKRKELFGMWQAKESLRKEEQFILCEGAMDVLALHQMGYTQAVAPLGSAFTMEQLQLAKRFATSALLLMDGDAAGQKAIRSAAILCEQAELGTLRAVRLPAQKDPSECLEYDQSDILTKSVKNAMLYFDFLLQETLKEIPKGNIDQQLEASSQIFEYIHEVQSPARRESYLKLLATKLHLSFEALLAEYERFDKGYIYQHSDRGTVIQDVEVPNDAKRYDREALVELFTACLMHGELFQKYKDNIMHVDFTLLNLQEIYDFLDKTPANFVNIDKLLENYALNASIKEMIEEKRLSAMNVDESWHERAHKAMIRIFIEELSYQRGRFLLNLVDNDKDVMMVGELQQEVNDLSVELQEMRGGVHG